MLESPSFQFRVEKQIGEGAMGVVYRAYDPALGRRVAIKTLHPRLSEDLPPEAFAHTKRRFLQEARAAAALAHPNVTTIYRVGKADDMPYIAMEWLDGRTVEELIEARGRIDVMDAVTWTIATLDALHAAHMSGIVHRDVKPANLMVLADDRVKVMDFGVARVQGSDLVKTQENALIGTPRYAAPEQFLFQPVDARSDIFAVGVVLYEMLVGLGPFAGRTTAELARNVLAGEVIPLDRVRDDLPGRLVETVHRALRRERAERFPDANAMAMRLRDVLVGLTQPAVGDRSRPVSLEATMITPSTDNAPDHPVLAELPHDPMKMALGVLKGWPRREMRAQPTEDLIERLMDRPVHTAPFSGAVYAGRALLLFYDGFVLAAADVDTGLTGDQVIESLPTAVSAVLFTPPDYLTPRVLPLLASLLHRPKVTHRDLDSSFVDIPALADKFAAEQFTGVIHMRREGSRAFVLVDDGANVMTLYSHGWDGVPIDQHWRSWVTQETVHVCVSERRFDLAAISYRRVLQDFRLHIEPVEVSQTGQSSTGSRARRRSASGAMAGVELRVTPEDRTVDSEVTGTLGHIHHADPTYRVLRWMVDDLYHYFDERDRVAGWKYLAGWIPDVRSAILHHDLPHPHDAGSENFDLVTTNEDGKVLHLVRRVAAGTVTQLERFIDDVIVAKKARIATGDVGGAILVAPAFSDEVLGAYRARTRAETSRSWMFSLQKAVTSYEGFVRLSATRGFHLLLVEEIDGKFEPILTA